MARNSATFAARTGCSLLGTMYLKIDSIQCATAGRNPFARAGPGFWAERMMSRRSKPNAATACSSRLASPRLSASGKRPCACGSTTASVSTPLRRIQAASAGSCSGRGVHSALSRSWYMRGGSKRTMPVSAAHGGHCRGSLDPTSTIVTPRSPSVIGSRASTCVRPNCPRPARRRKTSLPNVPVAPAISSAGLPAANRGRFAACNT